MEFSLNGKIKLHLTQAGKEVLSHNYNKVAKFGGFKEKKPEEFEGIIVLPMWEFMEDFTPHLRRGEDINKYFSKMVVFNSLQEEFEEKLLHMLLEENMGTLSYSFPVCDLEQAVAKVLYKVGLDFTNISAGYSIDGLYLLKINTESVELSWY